MDNLGHKVEEEEFCLGQKGEVVEFSLGQKREVVEFFLGQKGQEQKDVVDQILGWMVVEENEAGTVDLVDVVLCGLCDTHQAVGKKK